MGMIGKTFEIKRWDRAEGKVLVSEKLWTPLRIAKIPCVMEEHDEVNPDGFKRESIGLLSNCPACHTTTEKGICDDDYVSIPR